MRTGLLCSALVLAAVPALGQELPLQLTWVDRTGAALETLGPPGAYRGPDLSIDGTQLAVHRHDGTGGDIWVDDRRGGLTRLTSDGSGRQDNASPIFSPDGTRIVFASFRNHKWGLYLQRADGTGGEELLIESGSLKMPMSWSPDGQFIVYWVGGGSQWIISVNGVREPRPLHDLPSSHAQISPDGKWVAFNSLGQIFVKPFPGGEGLWQVSTDGGAFARWRGDSRELYYMGGGFFFSQMMAAEITVTGSSLTPGTPRPLFDSEYVNLGHSGNYHTYAVSPDGERFLIPRIAPQSLAVFDRDGRSVRALDSGVYWSPVWSPDGTRVAVIKDSREVWVLAADGGRSVRLSSNQPQDQVTDIVWSPDGRQLVYHVRQRDAELLYRVLSDGTGAPQVLYRLPGFGISLVDWSPDGRSLIYGSSQLAGNRLFALPVTEDPEPVEILRSDLPIIGARVSPDGRFLAYQTSESPESPTSQIRVRPFDVAGGTDGASWLVPGEANLTMGLGISWRQDGGELYYLGPNRGVMAVDVRVSPGVEFGPPRRLFTLQDSAPERENAGLGIRWGAVSRDGRRVVYSLMPPGVSSTPDPVFRIVLLDREGRAVQTVGEPGLYGQVALSPDGTRIATRYFDTFGPTGRSDIWSIDVASGAVTRITDDRHADFNPLWSPDGRHILYVSARAGGYQGIYRKAADGAGNEELLYRNAPGSPVNLRDISPDGRYVTFNSGGVVLVVRIDDGADAATREAIELSRDEFTVASGVFSPDGRFIAYGSNETDRFELYVRPFDSAAGSLAPDGKQRVSNDGTGPFMFWRGDGRELYFTDTEPDLVMMAVDVGPGPEFQPGAPRVLFHLPGDVQGNIGVSKYASRDGQRFAFIMPVEEETATSGR